MKLTQVETKVAKSCKKVAMKIALDFYVKTAEKNTNIVRDCGNIRKHVNQVNQIYKTKHN
jgi:hypothetical protein